MMDRLGEIRLTRSTVIKGVLGSALAPLTAVCGRINQESKTAAQPTPVATRPAVPTAVILGQTPTPIPLEVTDFSFRPISPTEVGINFCTKGRPINTTLRVSFYRDKVTPTTNLDQLDKDMWEIIKELGVPCFNTNPSNLDWPIWRIDSLASGYYLIRGEARPAEAQGNWGDPIVKREYRLYNLTKP